VAELAEAALARWFDPAGAAGPEPAEADMAAVAAFARLALHQLDAAETLAARALAAPHDAFAGVLARRTLVVCDLTSGRLAEALRRADDVLALTATEGERGWAIETAALRTVVLAALGRFDDARVQADAARVDAAAFGAPSLVCWAELHQNCLLALSDPAAARAGLAALADRCREAGYPLGEGAARRALGAVLTIGGDHAAAADPLARALDLFVRIGHPTQVRVTLRWAAVLAGPATRATLSRAAGGVRAPATEILDRAWLDPLPGAAPADAPSVTLPEAVALARRELALATDRDPPAAAPVSTGAMEVGIAREGAVWALTYAGRTVRLGDAKGLRDLATLLTRPGREVHSTELAGAAVTQPDTGEVLDAQARRRYEARIVELQAELSEAEDAHDRGRAEAAGLELDLLVDQLAAARGLAGRARRGGGTAERARTAVTWRIRAAIRRVDAVHPDLGRHLRATVRTGLWCRYDPDLSPVPGTRA
jgi:hypothetical protein